jgi:hypothetical protein
MLADNLPGSATAYIFGVEEERTNTAAGMVKGEIGLQRQLDEYRR